MLLVLSPVPLFSRAGRPGGGGGRERTCPMLKVRETECTGKSGKSIATGNVHAVKIIGKCIVSFLMNSYS